jgi:hypothetical protein
MEVSATFVVHFEDASAADANRYADDLRESLLRPDTESDVQRRRDDDSPAHRCESRRTILAFICFGFLGLAPLTLSAQQQLFLGNDHTPGSVLQYNLPISGSSTSNYAIASNNVVAVAEDASGNLAVGDNAGNLKFFTAPLSGASVPSAAFTNGAASNNGQIVFTPAGDFFAATLSNRVNMFTHPFTNASTPSSFVTDAALVSATGVGLDAAQNLYISNAGVSTCIFCPSSSNLLVYAPPYTGAPIITNLVVRSYGNLTISGTQLFVDNVSLSDTLPPSGGSVDVYNLPITGASAPAFSITTGVKTFPEGAALDASGNLYIVSRNAFGNPNATVTVYAPPFSATSAPTTTLNVNASSFGIAIGNGSAASIPAIGHEGLIALFALLAVAGFLAMLARS